MRHIVVGIVSVVIGVLLARLLLLLLAADPQHPFVVVVLAITQPLVWPLAWLDARQPRYGVRFERATFLLALGLWITTAMSLHWRRKAERHG